MIRRHGHEPLQRRGGWFSSIPRTTGSRLLHDAEADRRRMRGRVDPEPRRVAEQRRVALDRVLDKAGAFLQLATAQVVSAIVRRSA